MNSIFNLFFCLSFVLDLAKHLTPTSFVPHLYQDLPPVGGRKDDNNPQSQHNTLDLTLSLTPFGSKLGILLPDPAPEPGIKLHDTAPEPDMQSSKQLPFDNHHEISITFLLTSFICR